MAIIKGDQSVSRNMISRNFSQQRTITTVSAGTLTLSSFSSTTQIFEGSTTGQIVNLGDATGYIEPGLMFILINDSTTTISVRDFGSAELYSLKKNDRIHIILKENSTQDGEWIFSSFSVESSASPPFILGRSGTSPANTWLLNESVPSNIVGIPIFVDDGVLSRVSVKNENTSTFNLEIYEHDGTTFTLLHTVSVASARGETDSDLNIPITFGKELAAKISTGSGKNVKVALSLRGLA